MRQKMRRQDCPVVIVGAGPAGLLAALAAARSGARVTLLEKGTTCGRKLLMTGGGRCNLTQDAAVADFINGVHPDGRWLRPALRAFSQNDLRTLLEQLGVPTRTETDNRVFPSAGDARTVRDALVRAVLAAGVTVRAATDVRQAERTGYGFRLTTNNGVLHAAILILACGGQSYPATGSDGGGYRLAEALGHNLIAPRPALVPLDVTLPWPGYLQGVALDDVRVRLLNTGLPETSGSWRRGALLCTHRGVSGPAVLNLSRGYVPNGYPWALEIDLNPDKNESDMVAQMLACRIRHPRRSLVNALDLPFPRALLGHLLNEAGIEPSERCGDLQNERAVRLARLVRSWMLPLRGTAGFAAAMVTAGGIPTAEIDPRSMQSRRCPGLCLAGEMLDLDGDSGGYNLQIAFSTGRLAGESAALAIRDPARLNGKKEGTLC